MTLRKPFRVALVVALASAAVSLVALALAPILSGAYQGFRDSRTDAAERREYAQQLQAALPAIEAIRSLHAPDGLRDCEGGTPRVNDSGAICWQGAQARPEVVAAQVLALVKGLDDSNPTASCRRRGRVGVTCTIAATVEGQPVAFSFGPDWRVSHTSPSGVFVAGGIGELQAQIATMPNRGGTPVPVG